MALDFSSDAELVDTPDFSSYGTLVEEKKQGKGATTSASTYKRESSDFDLTGNTQEFGSQTIDTSSNKKSLLAERIPDIGGNFDPMLNPKFVEDFKQELAQMPIENRLNALMAYAETDKSIYGRAARVILAGEEYKNKKVTEIGKQEAMELLKNAKPVAPKFGNGPSKAPAFPEANPNFFETIDGVTPKTIAEANQLAMGIEKIRDESSTPNAKYEAKKAFNKKADDKTKAYDQSLPSAIRGYLKGGRQAVALSQGSIGLIGELTGNNSIKEWGLESYKENSDRAQNYSVAKNFTDINSASDAAGWVAENSGYVAFQAAQALLSAGLGGVIGETVGKKALGSIVGMAVANGAQTFGSVYGEAVDESIKTGNEVDMQKVLIGATASMAIDTLADKMGLDALTAKAFKGNALTRIAKATGLHLSVQGGTEAAQLIPEEFGAGRDPFRKGMLNQYINEAAVGALGGVGPAIAQSVNRAPINPQITPADIVAPTVTTFDQAIATAQASVTKPVSDSVNDIVSAYQQESESAVNKIDAILSQKASADQQLIDQIRATAPAETIAPEATNAPSQAATQAQAIEAGAPAGIAPEGQSAATISPRADVLEAAGINDANTVQANPTPATPTSTVPADVGRAVPDSGVLPTARLEPTIQPEPAPVQSLPKARADLTEPQRQQVNAANEQQLEDLYQQDVKDAINQRLGRSPTEKIVSKRSLFKTFLREHGINSSVASDVTGERGIRANAKLPATFRKNGLNLDLLAERAVEAGYLTQAELDSPNDNGGVNRLTQMIQAEIAGERQTPIGEQSEGTEAQSERIQRGEIEDMADKLGLPYDGEINTDRLASMVKRVNDRLESENLKSWGETKGGKALGRYKADRVLQYAKSEVARIERKRVQYEREIEGFAEASINVQDALLDVLVNADGNFAIVRQADIQAESAWNELNGQWEDQNGQANTTSNRTAQETSTPNNQGTRTSAENVGENRTEAQQGRDAEEGLTAPTREDVLAQQERAAEAEKAQAAADKAKEKAAKEAADKKEIDARQQASAENFQLGQSAEDSLSGQASMFDAPADKPASAMSVQDLLRAAADKMDDAAKPADVKYSRAINESMDEDTGLPLNADGTVTVYHHTSKASADSIRETGILKAQAEPDVYVTTRKETDTGYGDTAVAIRVNPERLTIDDEFPNGRKDFRLNVGKPGGSVRVVVESESTTPNQDGSINQTLKDVESAWAKLGLQKTQLSENKGVISLSRIEVPATERNQGAGTKAMEDLTAYADASGQRIVLTPSSDFGGNKAKLVDFYKRFGFIDNKGRNRDFTTRETMYRDAKSTKFSRATPDGKAEPLVDAWKKIAENDAVFKYKKSDSNDLVQVFKEVAPNLVVEQVKVPGLADAYRINIEGQPNKKGFVSVYDDSKVELNMYHMKSGDSGSAAYAAVGNWAFNTDKKFSADRLGISDLGVSRRLENVTSLVLKFGTTKFLDMQDNPLGVKWENGNDAKNIESLLKASYDRIADKFPNIADYKYDFSSERFVPSSQGVGKGIKFNESEIASAAREAGVSAGPATIKRAIITGTILRGESLPTAGIAALRDKVYGGTDSILYARNSSGTTNTNTNTSVTSTDQSDAIGLNRTMARYFNDATWNNAYEQVDLPDSLNDFATAASTAYGAKIVGIKPTSGKFDAFNGININGTNFINVDAKVSFINITGHEIYHDIEKNRPDLHEWLKTQANQYYQNFDEYQAKLNALVLNGEQKYTKDTAQSELLADAMGDALADTQFLQKLAEDNPSKFKDLLRHVIAWLKNVSSNFSKKDLGSSKYFTDVEALRKHLNQVLLAYASNTPIERMAAMQAPEFSREQVTSKPLQTDTPAFKAWFGDSKVVDAEGKPQVMYHGTAADFNSFDNSKTGSNDRGMWGKGHYFAASAETANSYALRQGDAARVIPAYVSIKNPLILNTGSDLVTRLPDGSNVKELLGDNLDGAKIKQIAISGGHDGVIQYRPNGLIGDVVAYNPEQIKSAIGNNGNFDASNPDIRYSRDSDKNEVPAESKWQGRQRVVQDKFNRFKVLQNWLTDKGITLSEGADVYQAETLMSGRIASRKEDFREKQMQPLIAKTQKAGISMEDIGDYLKAQHAPEANKRARELHNNDTATAFGVTDDEAQATIDEFKKQANFAELKDLANEWRDITTQTKQILLDGGILSKDMVAAWDATYSAYIPVKGSEESQGTGKGLSVNGKTKRRMGHGLRDEAILENILRDHERAIQLDEKNNVGKALIRFALEAKNDDIITVGQPEKRQIMKAGEVMLQASPMLAENEVNVYIDGHAVRVQINDEIAARAYTALGVEHLNTVLSAGREVNTWLSKAYTGYSPDFILTNPIRDAIQGSMTLTGEYGALTAAKIFTNYPKAVKELVKHFNNHGSSQLVTDYRANGGSTGAAYLSDLERIGNDLQASYDEYAGVMDTYSRAYDEAVKDGRKTPHLYAAMRSGIAGIKKVPVVGHFLRLMESVNAVTENALRVATFDTLVKDGVSPSKAATQAKNLMNFNRKGEISNTAGSLYLFFNPSVQGSQVMFKAMVESEHKGQVQALAGMMVLSAIALAELAMSGGADDEEKWKNTPDYVKDGNLVIGFGDKQFTLTLPYGYRVFHTLGNVISEYMHGGNGYKLGIRLASSVFSNFSPLGNPMEGNVQGFSMLPTIPKMLLGPSVNQDSFGREIAPKQWNNSKPDSQIMNRNTKGTVYASTASGLNSFTGGNDYKKGLVDVSPETLKYWVSSLTGGAGKFAFDMVNIPKATYNEVPLATKDIPIARRFIREVGVSDTRSAFWERAKEAKDVADAFAAAKKAHDGLGAQSILKDNSALIALSKYAESQQKVVKAKRDEADRINANKDLTPKQKNEKLKLIEMQEAAVYTRFIKVFDERTKVNK